MKVENVFTVAKNDFDRKLQNFDLFQSRNEKNLKLFLEVMESEKLDRKFNEWIDNERKAFADYREVMLSGLDYLSENLEKGKQELLDDSRMQ